MATCRRRRQGLKSQRLRTKCADARIITALQLLYHKLKRDAFVGANAPTSIAQQWMCLCHNDFYWSLWDPLLIARTSNIVTCIKILYHDHKRYDVWRDKTAQLLAKQAIWSMIQCSRKIAFGNVPFGTQTAMRFVSEVIISYVSGAIAPAV